MIFQPGFAAVAALIGDPAREAMLVALSDGRALPAGELAAAAGISAQSASRHLQKMVDGDVLTVWSQGRFRYYQIANGLIVAAIESLCSVAQSSRARRAHRRMPPPELCFARRCYDHLAGQLGVTLPAAFETRGYVTIESRNVQLTKAGASWLKANNICVGDIPTSARKPALRLCMDWTERRPHFAGPIANAILRHLIDNRLLRPSSTDANRALRLTAEGRRWFSRNAGIEFD
jgi:DNA-binding transcriptional ArsR family regulator